MKIRSKRRENTISPDQKKLTPSSESFKLGPSNSTGGPLSGTGYPAAIVIIIILLLTLGFIMKFFSR